MEKFGKKCKGHIMDEIMASIKERPNIFVTNYMGLTTSELEILRKDLGKGQGRYFVVKNSLAKKVFEKLKLDEAAGMIEGGVGLGLAGEDMISACRVLAKFSKDHASLKIKAAFLDGSFVMADRVKEIANIPSREVLLTQLVTGIKSPITSFAGVLGGILRKFVYCVDAIKKVKESQPKEQKPEETKPAETKPEETKKEGEIPS